MGELVRTDAFLRDAGCHKLADGRWRETVLETVDAGPSFEIVQDIRTGKRYRVEPIDDPDPFLIPVVGS